MAYTRNEVITGATVLSGMAAIVILLIGMGNLAALFQESYPVRVYFNEIGYLKRNADVLQAGVRIGQVRSIEHLPPGERVTLVTGDSTRPAVCVVLAIEEGHTINPMSPIYIDTKGLLGDPFIAISGGPVSESEAIQPNQAVMGQDASSLVLAMSRLTGAVEGIGLDELDAGEIQRKVSAAIESATNLLDTLKVNVDAMEVPELRRDLGRLLSSGAATLESASAVLAGATMQRIVSNLDGLTANLEVASASVNRTLGDVRRDVGVVMGESREFITRLSDLVERNEGNIDTILTNLGAVSEDLDESLKPALESARDLMSQLEDFTSSNREDLDEIVINLRDFTRNAEDFSQTLAESPWQLIWKTEKRREAPHDAPVWNGDDPDARVPTRD